METISLTIPLELNALTRASDMLHGLAIDLGKETAGATVTKSVGAASITETTKTVQEETQALTEPAAAKVFAQVKTEPVAIATATDSSPATAGPASVSGLALGVDLDGEGLPWDHRIHASSKAKLSKKPNGWKKKRGVDVAIIAQVEAELRAAMAAGPANPVPVGNAAAIVNTAAAPAPAPTAVTTVAVTPVSLAPAPAPAPAPAAAVGVTTFPALMAAITSKAIDQAAVTAAVNAQGLTALPLLAARPDLIPAVAAALGV